MDDEKEPNPVVFNHIWPSIKYIKCPACETYWDRPGFGSSDAFFPAPRTPSKYEERTGITRAHCPRCGVLLPELTELKSAGLVGVSPVADKPFIGTISGIRQFLIDSRGCVARLWSYEVSHSNLALMIRSKQDAEYAFIVCTMTRTVEFPTVHWKSSLTLKPTNDPDEWELLDEEASIRIVCKAIGIFHQLTSYS